ncbi:hypothetical protein CEUSTIGMA_g8460.t1 [Chlamydomonas eustigma]|uniref:Uncharacterized protein n=1 Tax=Chlamydomonas eustigma TaxID=1157962 RepID=A0A250XD75_9CHLO|nr:hypothetical protein CEUSTIGMA_g8460.t1 [Chlamydomonas eustigma]|eukprot:GAX81025.1 hypothetical protein CEUSTIGMA_g8460.t1 [Chlamydomonas eustigma]
MSFVVDDKRVPHISEPDSNQRHRRNGYSVLEGLKRVVAVTFQKLEKSSNKFVHKFLKQASPVKGILKGKKQLDTSTEKKAELQHIPNVGKSCVTTLPTTFQSSAGCCAEEQQLVASSTLGKSFCTADLDISIEIQVSLLLPPLTQCSGHDEHSCHLLAADTSSLQPAEACAASSSDPKYCNHSGDDCDCNHHEMDPSPAQRSVLETGDELVRPSCGLRVSIVTANVQGAAAACDSWSSLGPEPRPSLPRFPPASCAQFEAALELLIPPPLDSPAKLAVLIKSQSLQSSGIRRRCRSRSEASSLNTLLSAISSGGLLSGKGSRQRRSVPHTNQCCSASPSARISKLLPSFSQRTNVVSLSSGEVTPYSHEKGQEGMSSKSHIVSYTGIDHSTEELSRRLESEFIFARMGGDEGEEMTLMGQGLLSSRQEAVYSSLRRPEANTLKREDSLLLLPGQADEEDGHQQQGCSDGGRPLQEGSSMSGARQEGSSMSGARRRRSVMHAFSFDTLLTTVAEAIPAAGARSITQSRFSLNGSYSAASHRAGAPGSPLKLSASAVSPTPVPLRRQLRLDASRGVSEKLRAACTESLGREVTDERSFERSSSASAHVAKRLMASCHSEDNNSSLHHDVVLTSSQSFGIGPISEDDLFHCSEEAAVDSPSASRKLFEQRSSSQHGGSSNLSLSGSFRKMSTPLSSSRLAIRSGQDTESIKK